VAVVGIVRSQTKATDFLFFFFNSICLSSKVIITSSKHEILNLTLMEIIIA
jgi:hypothetical protein